MPTGYTCDVADGKITTFAEFAKLCSRAFGALIHMRDDHMGSDITLPVLSDYHEKALKEATARLEELQSMTAEQKASEAATSNTETSNYYAEQSDKKKATRNAYLSMLEQVRAWDPPTPEHIEFKGFMEKQLEESIDFDCQVYPAPPPQSVEEWHEKAVTEAARSVEYHAKGLREEQERIASRRKWIIALMESIGEPIPQDEKRAA